MVNMGSDRMSLENRKGLLIIHTGDGKGKTTAALGLALRSWGDGFRVLILQFIKGGWTYGEMTAIEKIAALPEELGTGGKIELRRMGKGFTRRSDKEADKEEHIKAAKEALQEAEKEIISGKWDLIILDEINYAVKFGLISPEEVREVLKKRPEDLHVVMTGRDAHKDLQDMADLVTEMTLIKHPFQQGIKAQKGIEF